MKWMTKKKVERYAGLISRIEMLINARLRRWSDALQQRTDAISYRTQLILLMIGVSLVTVVCVLVIYHALK